MTRPGQSLQRLRGGHRRRDRVADDQHRRTGLGSLQGETCDLLRQVQQGCSIHRHALCRRRIGWAARFVPGLHAAFGPAQDGVRHFFRLNWRGARRAQQPGTGGSSQGGRQQQGLPTCAHVVPQQGGQQGLHVAVGGMHLIHHQQVAQQRGAAQVRVTDPHRTQQCLIHRAHRNGSGQEALWMFRRPARPVRPVVPYVVPLEAEIGQRAALRVVHAGLARHRKHHRRRRSTEHPGTGQPVTKPLDAFKHRGCGHAGGQGEVQPVHQALLEQVLEAPKRSLCLA